MSASNGKKYTKASLPGKTKTTAYVCILPSEQLACEALLGKLHICREPINSWAGHGAATNAVGLPRL